MSFFVDIVGCNRGTGGGRREEKKCADSVACVGGRKGLGDAPAAKRGVQMGWTGGREDGHRFPAAVIGAPAAGSGFPVHFIDSPASGEADMASGEALKASGEAYKYAGEADKYAGEPDPAAGKGLRSGGEAKRGAGEEKLEKRLAKDGEFIKTATEPERAKTRAICLGRGSGAVSLKLSRRGTHTHELHRTWFCRLDG